MSILVVLNSEPISLSLLEEVSNKTHVTLSGQSALINLQNHWIYLERDFIN